MRYVIVGASAAGLAAAESIREVDGAAEVTLVDRDDRQPYARPLISYWLAGEIETDQVCLPSGVQVGTEWVLGRRAVWVDPAGKLVLDDDSSLLWDRLLIATGADSKPIGAEGEDVPGVFGLRSWADATAIDRTIREGARRALVLGGGLVGVKAALALANRGLETSVCITSAYPLSQNVGPDAGAIAAAALEEEGVEVMTGCVPEAIVAGTRGVTAVRFSSPGIERACDLVIRGKGVVPCGDLLHPDAPGAGGPVSVDERMATSVPGVWAAGDVVRCRDCVSGAPATNAIWPVAVEQGRVAGMNMAGAEQSYAGSFARNSVRIGRWHFISAGVPARPSQGLAIRTRSGRDYLRQTVERDGVLAGFASAERNRSRPLNSGLAVNAVGLGEQVDGLGFDPLSPDAHPGERLFQSPALQS